MSKILVTVDDKFMFKQQDVRDTLKRKGFQIQEAFPMLGIITGEYDGDLADLTALSGVKAAEIEQILSVFD